MNVNPFSYLIEKLKGYVSKSGDTVFGDLTVNAENGTAGADAYTYLKVGNQTPKSSAKHSTGLLRLCGENGKYTDIYAPNSTASRDIVFPNASGTVALTSDITTVTKGSATFDITVASGGFVKYVQVNKVVFVALGFTVSDNSTYNATICHDLPIPELPTGGIITFVTVFDEADGTMARLRLDYNSTSGCLTNYYGKQVVNGHAYISSFCYIAK